MCFGHPFCTCTVKPLPVSAVSSLQQLPHIISKAHKFILSPSHPLELFFPGYLLILHSMLQICVSRVTVTFIMPSLLLLTHSNSWNNISCAILHFSAATNIPDRIMQPHSGDHKLLYMRMSLFHLFSRFAYTCQ